jgi:hypothetical protein
MKLLPLECLADAGRQLGKINRALDRLYPVVSYETGVTQPPNADSLDGSLLEAARRFHQWDGKNTAELGKFTHCIVDAKRRLLVESVIDTFCSTLLESGVSKEFRKGVIHGDYNDANILMGNDFHVTGVIDFGDSVERYVTEQPATIHIRSSKLESLVFAGLSNRPMTKLSPEVFARSLCQRLQFEELERTTELKHRIVDAIMTLLTSGDVS